jgi:thiol-disulfide isomerase/thioredoxin
MKITIRNLVIAGMAVLFAGLLFFLARTGLRVAFGSSAGDAISYLGTPAWELMDPDGKPVKSSDFDGKVLILDFSTTWCPPFRAEIPVFIELQNEYGEKGLVVVGVLLDEEKPAGLKQFVKEFGINYPVVIGAFNIKEYFGGMGIPSTFVINRSGKIVARHIGFVAKETLEREITPLL